MFTVKIRISLISYAAKIPSDQPACFRIAKISLTRDCWIYQQTCIID